MRLRTSKAILLVTLAGAAGCSSVLGLDDFAGDAGAGGGATTSSSSSSATQGPGASGTTSTSGDGGGGVAASSTNTATSTTSDGGGGGDPALGPGVVISSASVANNGTTNSSRATFLFGSDPPGAAITYECQVDGGTFDDCSGGFDVRLFAGGLHILGVRGRDADGVAGPVLERKWTIEAVGTTILALRTHTVPVDTLVTITSNVRETMMVTYEGEQNIFVQEAEGAFSAVRNRAIRTFAKVQEAPMTPGLALTVTGTYQAIGGSDAIAAAEYIRGDQLAAYSSPSSRDTEEIDSEDLESVLIRVSYEVPGFNCSSGCPGDNEGVCFHGCEDCHPLGYVDFTSTGTFEYGFYKGVLVGNIDRFFWFVESSEGGDDICL